MRNLLSLLPSVWLLAAALASQQQVVPPAAPAPTPRAFVRHIEGDDGGHVDVLVATYRKGDASVTLHAALHIADAGHYEALQQRFTAFDALLYELIADAETRPYPGERDRGDTWLTTLQSGLGAGLQLATQVRAIDYRQANFVHADVTPEQFEAALAKAGKDVLGEMISKLGDSDREREANQRRLDVVTAFRNGRGAHEVRVMGARWITAQLSGPGESREPTVVIEARNERCLEVLQEQLAAGRKKLGVYYGAAHMPHMERRLVQDLGWKPEGEEWVQAWDCRASRFPVEEKGLHQKRYRARQDLRLIARFVWFATSDRVGGEVDLGMLRAKFPGTRMGANDGVDPWGRPYVIRRAGDEWEVRCLGGDGASETADDQAQRVEMPEELRFDTTKFDADIHEQIRKSLEKASRETELGRRKAAEDRAREAADALVVAAERYWVDHQRVPTLGELANPSITGPSPGPKDPWDHDFVLRVGDKAGRFVVVSAGPDGKFDTDDDISSVRREPKNQSPVRRPTRARFGPVPGLAAPGGRRRGDAGVLVPSTAGQCLEARRRARRHLPWPFVAATGLTCSHIPGSSRYCERTRRPSSSSRVRTS